MPHPEPERREHAPPGSSLLAGLTPEPAQAVTYGTGPLLLDSGPRVGEDPDAYPPDRISAICSADHG